MSGRNTLSAIAIAAIAAHCISGAPAVGATAYGPVQQMLTAKSSEGPYVTTGLCSQGWSNIDGAAIRIVIPAGANQLVTARFSGEAGSSGSSSGGIRIMSGARELLPAFFDTQVVPAGFQGLPFALERSILLAPGAHNITVQFCVNDNAPHGNQVGLAMWHLTVEAAPPQ